MPEVLRLALLAFPAGLIGFIAAPCCGLLAPAYLPFALATPPPAPSDPGRILPILSQPVAVSIGSRPAVTPSAAAESAAVTTRAGAWRSLAAFLAGFCLFFVLLGATSSSLGQFLLTRLPLLEKIASGVIIALGLTLLLRLRIRVPGSNACINTNRLRNSPLGSFGMGFAIAITWAPCTGPTLGAILALSATTATVWTGSLLLLIYALGLAVPFALMTAALAKARRLLDFQQRHSRALEVAGGLLMIAVGVLILVGGWQAWLGPATNWMSKHGWPPI